MKVGIVGAGVISQLHLSALARQGRARVVGIADRDLERARAQAQRNGVPGAFAGLGELLAATKPDVVHVLTPPDTHAALAVEALDAGAHVFVEKPMAVTEAECQAMSAAAARANRQLCVGHCWLYTPAMLQARDLIASGTAGDVVQAAASFSFDLRRNPGLGQGHWAGALPGGIVEDLAVHPVSVLLSLIGAPRATTGATRTGHQLAEGKDEEMRALVDAERGLGSVSVSLGAHPDVALLDIWCTRMLLRLNLSAMVLTTERELPVPRKLARGLTSFDLAAQLVTRTVGATWRVLRKQVDGSYGITPLVHAFYEALEAGRPAPVGPAEGAQAVAVLRSIWPVRVPAAGVQGVMPSARAS